MTFQSGVEFFRPKYHPLVKKKNKKKLVKLQCELMNALDSNPFEVDKIFKKIKKLK